MHAGDLLRDYRILEEIQSGAAGTVYRAEHVVLEGRMVAIKVVREEHLADPRHQERLRNEGRLVALIGGAECPRSLVHLYDAGPLPEGGLFLVMEYLEDGSLRDELLRQERGQGRRSTADLLRLLAPLAQGLCWLHETLRIVHLDVKPENILFTARPRPRAKLVDFGIARPPQPAQPDGGLLLGTPGYVAPEVLSRGALSGKADVYSLGAVLYEVLTRDRPPSLSKAQGELRARGVPAPLRALVLRMLREASARPTMAEVAAQLQALCARGVTARERRGPRSWLTVGGLAAAGLAVWAAQRRLEERPPPPHRAPPAERVPVAPRHTAPTEPDARVQPQPRQGDTRRAGAAPAGKRASRARGCSLHIQPPVDYDLRRTDSTPIASVPRGTPWSCTGHLHQHVVIESMGYYQADLTLVEGTNTVVLKPRRQPD